MDLLLCQTCLLHLLFGRVDLLLLLVLVIVIEVLIITYLGD